MGLKMATYREKHEFFLNIDMPIMANQAVNHNVARSNKLQVYVSNMVAYTVITGMS